MRTTKEKFSSTVPQCVSTTELKEHLRHFLHTCETCIGPSVRANLTSPRPSLTQSSATSLPGKPQSSANVASSRQQLCLGRNLFQLFSSTTRHSQDQLEHWEQLNPCQQVRGWSWTASLSRNPRSSQHWRLPDILVILEWSSVVKFHIFSLDFCIVIINIDMLL